MIKLLDRLFNPKVYQMNTLKLEGAKYWRLYSDMHQDMYVLPKKRFSPSMLWMPEPLPEDKDTVLILAGDIWHAKKYFKYDNYSWLKDVSSRFKYVLVVLGNHDFWGGKYPDEYAKFNKYKEELEIHNLYLLQDSTLLIGDVKFIGASLWNELDNRNPEFIDEYNEHINDVKYIKWSHPNYPNSFKKWSAKQVIESFTKSRNYIFENAKREYPEQKVFVITHHPPSYALFENYKAEPEYIYDKHKKLYGNNLDDLIVNSDIDIWVHGHNHQSGRGKIGNTEIIANVVGYVLAPDENIINNFKYNPWFQEEL